MHFLLQGVAAVFGFLVDVVNSDTPGKVNRNLYPEACEPYLSLRAYYCRPSGRVVLNNYITARGNRCSIKLLRGHLGTSPKTISRPMFTQQLP